MSGTSRLSNIAGKFAHPGGRVGNVANFRFWMHQAVLAQRYVNRCIERAETDRARCSSGAGYYADRALATLEAAFHNPPPEPPRQAAEAGVTISGVEASPADAVNQSISSSQLEVA